MNPPIDPDACRRFVVLFHQFPLDHPRDDHWDLMLETESSLLTWALQEMPEPGKSISAVELANHRISYLEYQGPVSGNHGSVTRVLGGQYFWKSGSESDGKRAVLAFGARTMEIEFRGHGDALRIVVT